MKYSLGPREIPRAKPKGFPKGSRLESQYRHFHLAKNGPALAEAYAEVTAVSGNEDIAVAVKLIASVETVLTAMLTCSQSTIRSYSHQFNHPSLNPSIHHPSIDSFIHPSFNPSKIK